jgi:uncharacterized protein YdeI (YjbR/CyaY-like superfamily)
MITPMEPIYFSSPAEFRHWLETHHTQEKEVYVGYHKKGTGIPTLTWAESVDEALCFGWIDGIRKSVDEQRYKIRFTPRKADSIWSAVNIKRMGELTALGLVKMAGLKAFEKRKEDKSAIYAYEQKKDITLEDAYQHQFQANAKAWEWFQNRAPSYRQGAIHWVMSAKKEETRLKRLATLIEDSANGRTIASLTRR